MTPNFRRPDKPRHNGPRKGVPIDGILNPARSNRPNNEGEIANQFRRSYQPVKSPTSLTNFNRPDGYHSNQSQVLSPPAPTRTLEQPMTTERAPKISRSERRRARKAAKAHGRLHASGRRKGLKWALRSGAAILIVGVLIVGFIGIKAYIKSNNIFKGGGAAAALEENVAPAKLKGEGDGRVNVLILGKGGPGHDGADLTDTILLASIDPVQKEAALLSVPRDLWVQAAGGSSMKINAIYAIAKENALAGTKHTQADKDNAEKAGIAALEKKVTEVLGVPIHYYAMVDFEAFRKAIDSVGGITIDVKTALIDQTVAWELNNNPVIAPVGLQTFDGKRALFYARSRHGSARGDFDRTERQREVIVALKDKVLTIGTFANPVKVSQLLDAFGDHVRTDVGKGEISAFYALAKVIPSSKIASVGLADPPNILVTTGNINGQSVVVPKKGTFDYSDIQYFVRNNLRDAFLKSENAKLDVLNGTATTGLAGRKAQEFKSFGYTVGVIGDAPTKTYDKTILVDRTNGAKKYTKSYLEKRLGVSAVTTLPDPKIVSGADFVIILGKDAAGTP